MMLISTSLNFVQQLLAAELLFAVGFGMLLLLVSVCYLMGAAVQHGWTLMKQEAHKSSTRPHEALPARSLHPNTAASR
jgi:Na+-transporting methylmalonyl-CoA/oxaloacetate decarboxylase gamma subunit